jgi:hypothetical protein
VCVDDDARILDVRVDQSSAQLVRFVAQGAFRQMFLNLFPELIASQAARRP